MDWHKNGGLFIDTHNDVWKDTCYKQGPPVLHNMTVAPSGHALLIQWQDIPWLRSEKAQEIVDGCMYAGGEERVCPAPINVFN